MTKSGEEEDRATTEAAHWLIALEEAPDNGSLRARFDAWHARSDANAAAWADTSGVYDMMAKTKPAHTMRWAPATAQRATHRGAIRFPARLSARRRVTLAIVATAVAACLALIVLPGVVLRLQADYITSTAETRSLTLEDGSTIQLGPGSAVEIAYRDGDRGVRLMRGEALFEVVPNAERPFHVLANGVETTVLGTVFDVRLVDEGATVAVRQGHVRVAYAGTTPPLSERLEAGDSVRIARNGHVDRSALPPGEVAAWQRGQIVARDRSVVDVIDELRRSYQGTILITDGSLGRQRVTGVYNLADPVAALRAAAGIHGGVVRQISPWLLVVSGG